MKINNENIKWTNHSSHSITGKSTVVNLFARRDFEGTIDHAMHYFDMSKIKRQTVEEIRKNKKEFQESVLNKQIKKEGTLDVKEMVFLERALLDAMAYYQFFGLEYDGQLVEQCNKYCYKHIFILTRIPLRNDYARLEDEIEKIRKYNLIIKVYQLFACPFVYVRYCHRKELILSLNKFKTYPNERSK